jgi:hypothetical protein
MFSPCRCGSLYDPVGQSGLPYQTGLLYKEEVEFFRLLWRQPPTAAPEFFRLRPGAATCGQPAGESGVRW